MECSEECDESKSVSDPGACDTNHDVRNDPQSSLDLADDHTGDPEEEAVARRPMNAFLIFCKNQRRVVQEQNTHLDNRSVTKMLGEMWAAMSKPEKSPYVDMATKSRDAFIKANPGFRWFSSYKNKKGVKTASPKRGRKKDTPAPNKGKGKKASATSKDMKQKLSTSTTTNIDSALSTESSTQHVMQPIAEPSAVLNKKAPLTTIANSCTALLQLAKMCCSESTASNSQTSTPAINQMAPAHVNNMVPQAMPINKVPPPHGSDHKAVHAMPSQAVSSPAVSSPAVSSHAVPAPAVSSHAVPAPAVPSYVVPSQTVPSHTLVHNVLPVTQSMAPASTHGSSNHITVPYSMAPVSNGTIVVPGGTAWSGVASHIVPQLHTAAVPRLEVPQTTATHSTVPIPTVVYNSPTPARTTAYMVPGTNRPNGIPSTVLRQVPLTAPRPDSMRVPAPATHKPWPISAHSTASTIGNISIPSVNYTIAQLSAYQSKHSETPNVPLRDDVPMDLSAQKSEAPSKDQYPACGKLVEKVIESLYTQECGKQSDINKNAVNKNAVNGLPVSAAVTHKALPMLANSMPFSQHARQTNPSATVMKPPNTATISPHMTLGQIQETLIYNAVQDHNSINDYKPIGGTPHEYVKGTKVPWNPKTSVVQQSNTVNVNTPKTVASIPQKLAHVEQKSFVKPLKKRALAAMCDTDVKTTTQTATSVGPNTPYSLNLPPPIAASHPTAHPVVLQANSIHHTIIPPPALHQMNSLPKPSICQATHPVNNSLPSHTRTLCPTLTTVSGPLPTHPLPTHPLPTHPLPTHPLPTHPLPTHPLPPRPSLDSEFTRNSVTYPHRSLQSSTSVTPSEMAPKVEQKVDIKQELKEELEETGTLDDDVKRKSSRTNRAKRYKELIKQGVIRRNSNNSDDIGSRKRAQSEYEAVVHKKNKQCDSQSTTTPTTNLETVKVEKVEKVENMSSLKIEGATPMMKSENPQENGTKLESQQISLRGKTADLNVVELQMILFKCNKQPAISRTGSAKRKVRRCPITRCVPDPNPRKTTDHPSCQKELLSLMSPLFSLS